MKERIMWCVLDDQGNPRLGSLAWSKRVSISTFLELADGNTWEYYRDAAGFKCIRLQIAEFNP